MTQKDLENKIEYLCEFKRYDQATKEILKLIEKYVAQVIGKNDPTWEEAPQKDGIMWTTRRNDLRAEQRKRARL